MGRLFDFLVTIVSGDSQVKASVTQRGSKGAQSVELVDASGNQVTAFGGGEQYPDGEVVGAAKKGNLILGTDGTNYQIVGLDAAGHPQIDVLTSALPTGASTGAKQDTGNTSVASVDTKVGEVQATPTANTVLGRIKDLLTGIVLAAGSNVIGAVTQSGNWVVQSITNALPAGTNIIGGTRTEPTNHTLKPIRKTLADSGEVIAGVAGQKIYLTSLTISCSAALTVEVSWDVSPADDEVIEGGYFAANGGLHADYGASNPVISDAAEGLYCTITGTGNVKIFAKYYQE